MVRSLTSLSGRPAQLTAKLGALCLFGVCAQGVVADSLCDAVHEGQSCTVTNIDDVVVASADCELNQTPSCEAITIYVDGKLVCTGTGKCVDPL